MTYAGSSDAFQVLTLLLHEKNEKIKELEEVITQLKNKINELQEQVDTFEVNSRGGL